MVSCLRRLYLFCFALSLSLVVRAAFNPDSLRQIIDTIPNDSLGCIRLLDRCNQLRFTDMRAARFCADELSQRVEKLKNPYLQAEANFEQGILLNETGHYIESIEFLSRALKAAENIQHDYLQYRCLNSLGNIFGMQKQYKKALELYHKGIVLCRKLKKEKSEAVVLGNIGNCYYEQYDKIPSYLDSAVNYYRKALAIHLNHQDTVKIVWLQNSLALALGDQGKSEEALGYLKKSKVLIDLTQNHDDLIGYYNYMGRILMDLKRYDEALLYQDSCIQWTQAMDDKDFENSVYQSISDIYAAKGDYKNAYDYFLKYNLGKDSLVNAENFDKISGIQQQYEEEKKQREIQVLTLKGERKTILLYAIGGGLILVLLLSITLYNRYRLKHRSNEMLQTQNDIISQKNKDITDSINYAKRIQEAILPKPHAIESLFPDSFVLFMPRDIISGDFYWAGEKNNIRFMAVADCTGHGVPGALMSMIGSAMLQKIIIEQGTTNTGAILDKLSIEIVAALNREQEEINIKDGMDIAIIAYHKESNEIHFSGANNPLYLIQNGNIQEIKGDKQPIGIVDHPKPFNTHTLSVSKGDLIYLFSDGYADQFGGDKGKKFKYAQLKDNLFLMKEASLADQKDQLQQGFKNWKGILEQVDDVLICGIRI